MFLGEGSPPNLSFLFPQTGIWGEEGEGLHLGKFAHKISILYDHFSLSPPFTCQKAKVQIDS